MDKRVHILNSTMELADCKDKWTYNHEYNCYCLEDIIYTAKPTAARYQRLSIFIPGAYMNTDGTVNENGCLGTWKAKTAPIIFENNASGYAQMEHTWLGGPRNYAKQYLEKGMIYISCGCRGRQTRTEEGRAVGKSPATLIDIKTAIRFIKHNSNIIAGDINHIISVGWSAGGAMSSLIGSTGNCIVYDELLEENGAFMDETDHVFAAQVYCPIIDLEHADMAYEWLFVNDYDFEASPFAPGGTLTEFQKSVSRKLSDKYIHYFNSLGLKMDDEKTDLLLGEDGRSGTAYELLMMYMEKSATTFLSKLEAGELEETYSIDEYLNGDYIFETIDIEKMMEFIANKEGDKARMKPPMKHVQGDNKRVWLSWDGAEAHIRSLDEFLKNHRRRMKTCPSFDFLNAKSGENQLFGNDQNDFLHFDLSMIEVIESLKDEYPDEYNLYYEDYKKALGDKELEKRCYLINPFNFIGTEEKTEIAPYFRINVGSCDVDTSYTMSMTLAIKLMNTKRCNVEYNIVWDKPHCEADYPGDVCKWIETICK